MLEAPAQLITPCVLGFWARLKANRVTSLQQTQPAASSPPATALVQTQVLLKQLTFLWDGWKPWLIYSLWANLAITHSSSCSSGQSSPWAFSRIGKGNEPMTNRGPKAARRLMVSLPGCEAHFSESSFKTFLPLLRTSWNSCSSSEEFNLSSPEAVTGYRHLPMPETSEYPLAHGSKSGGSLAGSLQGSC